MYFKHDVMLGGETCWIKYTNEAFDGVVPTIDLYTPVYTMPDLSRRAPNTFALDERYERGLYIQDQITMFDKLHIVGGGRYDWVHIESASKKNEPITAANIATLDQGAFIPRAGVSYQVWPGVALCANWVESFGANNGVLASGGVLPPETATQYEAEVKLDMFKGRLTSTLACFDITKQNVKVAVTPTLFEAIGEAHSEGVELDVAAAVTDRLSVIGTYAYIDAVITHDPKYEGKRLPATAHNSGSLWAKYKFTDQFTIGLGAYAMVAYDALGGTGMVVLPGEPLTVLGSIRVAY